MADLSLQCSVPTSTCFGFPMLQHRRTNSGPEISARSFCHAVWRLGKQCPGKSRRVGRRSEDMSQVSDFVIPDVRLPSQNHRVLCNALSEQCYRTKRGTLNE